MKKEIYLVPYSHLDTQWRWEYPTTINKYLRKTMFESIEMFEKYPKHQFNFTGALRYQMMKEYFPDMFEKVIQYINEDRWHLAGTCLDETDALVPSVESSVRNILYGHLWQLETFGKSSKDYMIPDCFGFPENLPTVMKHCGINGFSSNKLTWGSAVGIPFEIGKWTGPDGSKIVCAFNPCRYDSHLELPVFMNLGRLHRLKKLGQKNNVWKSFQYYGVGDIGGAPKEGSIKRALASISHYDRKNGSLKVRQGAADMFFDELNDEEISRLDTYRGDLLLTRHSAGTLTSAAIMKRWNRKNEQMAFAAEAAAVQAWLTTGTPYPTEKIKNSWYRIISCQMHDILPGTSTPTAYEFSYNDEILAMNGFTSVLDDSARALAPYIPGKGSLLLYNPYEGIRKEYVDVPYDNPDAYSHIHVIDANGRKYPAQLNTTANVSILTFMPSLESFGWSRFEIIEGACELENPVTCSNKDGIYTLENDAYKVSISDTGRIGSILDKIRNREILKSPMSYEFQKEKPTTFPSWNMDWRDRKKKPFRLVDNGGKVEIIEDGLLRKTLRIKYKVNDSLLVKDISLGSGDDMVRFTERINWSESGCSLKLKLQVDMDEPDFTYNWETSRVKRGINHKKQYEVPSRLWMDVSDNDFGFSLIEDSKFGYDRPSKDTIRMTLLYTPGTRYLNGFRDQKSQDWGQHTIRYAVKSHDGIWHETDSAARKFNQPVRSFIVDHSISKVEKSIDTVTLDNNDFGVMSVKKAELHDAVIIRLYERSGKTGDVKLTFNRHIGQAWEVNGIEDIVRDLNHELNYIVVTVPKNGIMSVMVKFKHMPDERVIAQQPMHLPMNSTLFSSNNESCDGILPRELVPDIISDGPIQFNIKVADTQNALKCSKESLPVGSGYNKLSLLGGAIEDKTIALRWLDENGHLLNEEHVMIPALTGFIGQWDIRTWKRKPTHLEEQKRDYAWLNKCTGIQPGYVKRDRVAWYTTHTHDNGSDKAYDYGYLYHITIDIPDGTAILELPDDSSVLLAGATLWNTEVDISSNQHLKDKYDF